MKVQSEIEQRSNLASLRGQAYGMGILADDEISKAFYFAVENGRNTFNVSKRRVLPNYDAAVQLRFRANDEGRFFMTAMLVGFMKKDEVLLNPQYFNVDSKNYKAVGYPEIRPNYSLNEAINLLEGRSVMKHIVLDRNTCEAKKAYFQLDKNVPDPKGNYERIEIPYYDVSKLLDPKVIQNLQDSGRSESFIRNVEKGEIVAAKLVMPDGEVQKGYVVNDAMKQEIKLYDAYLKPIMQNQQNGLAENNKVDVANKNSNKVNNSPKVTPPKNSTPKNRRNGVKM